VNGSGNVCGSAADCVCGSDCGSDWGTDCENLLTEGSGEGNSFVCAGEKVSKGGPFNDMPRSEFCKDENACKGPIDDEAGALRQRLAAESAAGAAFQALFWRFLSPDPVPSPFQRLVPVRLW